MKGKKYYFILAGILLIGLSTIYFFRQQREKQFLDFEAYEIASVEARVSKLYNEDKTDISEDISAEELDEINELLNDLVTKEYNPKNEQRLIIVEEKFQIAKKMDEIQTNIKDLFEEGKIIKENISLNEVENLKEQVEPLKDKVIYYDRNDTALADAKKQVRDIEEATAFIENLFEDEFVRSDVTRENEEEVLLLINKIKNEKIRERLLAQAEILNLALIEAEEALALEEALAEEAAQQELEELEAEQYEAPSDSEWSSNNSSSTWTPPPTQPVYVPEDTEDETTTDESTADSRDEIPAFPEDEPDDDQLTEPETPPVEEEEQ